MTSPYDELLALCEVSLELVRDEQYEALTPVHEACRAVVEKLPSAPPPSAVSALRRVAALDAEKHRLLEQQARLVRDVLVRIQDGRNALGGYAQPHASARVDATG